MNSIKNNDLWRSLKLSKFIAKKSKVVKQNFKVIFSNRNVMLIQFEMRFVFFFQKVIVISRKRNNSHYAQEHLSDHIGYKSSVYDVRRIFYGFTQLLYLVILSSSFDGKLLIGREQHMFGWELWLFRMLGNFNFKPQFFVKIEL